MTWKLAPHGWMAIELELVRDGHLARVQRDRHGRRWRWSVTPLEVVEKSPSQPVARAYARGYMRSYERAIQAAEAALDGLVKAREADGDAPR